MRIPAFARMTAGGAGMTAEIPAFAEKVVGRDCLRAGGGCVIMAAEEERDETSGIA